MHLPRIFASLPSSSVKTYDQACSKRVYTPEVDASGPGRSSSNRMNDDSERSPFVKVAIASTNWLAEREIVDTVAYLFAAAYAALLFGSFMNDFERPSAASRKNFLEYDRKSLLVGGAVSVA